MGCSMSRESVSIISTKQVLLDGLQKTPPERSHSLSTRLLETRLVIWLCEETSDAFASEKDKLCKRIRGLQTYSDVNACVTFITSIEDERVFLVVSDSSRSIERFQHLPEIEKIYILNSASGEFNNEKQLLPKHIRVRDVDKLYPQLGKDDELCEMDLIPITMASASSQEVSISSNLMKHEAAFLFAQMLKEIIYRLKFESGSKDVFIDFCRAHYTGYDDELRVIDDFAKHYRPNKALRWLANPCFISRILNRVLRTREIDVIYKLGFFIKQIHLQLIRLYEENVSLMKQFSCVYRGKTMPYDEFDTVVKKNCGGFLSFTSFLITTTTKSASIDFVGERIATHPDRIGVIFEIDIHEATLVEKSPFALLKDAEMDRDEICFHMSTVFRIESVEQTSQNAREIWVVRLKPVTDNDKQLSCLIAPARSDEMHANPISYLSKLLLDMGEHRRAEQVFLGLLQDASVRSQPRRLVRVYDGLGALYTRTHEYVKALDHFEHALQTSLIYLQADHSDLAPIYMHIADSHSKQKNYLQSIQNYEKVIELLRHDTQQTNSDRIEDLHNRINSAKRALVKLN